jgi:hypothetical protein
MTCVRRSTSGFKSEAAVRTEQKLRDKHRQKGPFGTLPSSAAGDIKLPSDRAAALSFDWTLFGGSRNHHTSEYANAR